MWPVRTPATAVPWHDPDRSLTWSVHSNLMHTSHSTRLHIHPGWWVMSAQEQRARCERQGCRLTLKETKRKKM
jgi:hypothetical protein